MKHLLLVFLLSLSLAFTTEKSYSWDPEAAKFFPLAVGNQWSYRHVSLGGNPVPCWPSGPYNYIISITHDTVANGHKYYRFSNGDKLRVDSTTMNVYKLNNGTDCLYDSLLARKNNVVNSCVFWGVIGDSSMVLFAGENRKVRTTNGIGYFKKLMYGIGVYFHGGCELQIGFEQQLNGAIINGIQYGNMLGITQTGNEIPFNFSLSQNYPNPFNPTTNIKFDIAKSGFVKLTVFDVLGKEVQTLVNVQLSPGSYNYDFDASHLPSGIYYYKLESESFTQTKKMVLIK